MRLPLSPKSSWGFWVVRNAFNCASLIAVTRDRVAANQELPIEVTRGQLTLARTNERTIELEGRDESLSAQICDLTGIPETQSITPREVQIIAGVARVTR